MKTKVKIAYHLNVTKISEKVISLLYYLIGRLFALNSGNTINFFPKYARRFSYISVLRNKDILFIQKNLLCLADRKMFP